jgi:hypothetical protein
MDILSICLVVDLFLLVIAALAYDSQPWAPRGGFVLIVIALVLITLKLFGHG